MSAPMFATSAPVCRGCGQSKRELIVDEALCKTDKLCAQCAQLVELHAFQRRGIRFQIPSSALRRAEFYRSPAWLVAVDAWLEAGGAQGDES